MPELWHHRDRSLAWTAGFIVCVAAFEIDALHVYSSFLITFLWGISCRCVCSTDSLNGPSTFCLPTFVHMLSPSLKLTRSECVISILLFLTGGAGCFIHASRRASMICRLLLACFSAATLEKSLIFYFPAAASSYSSAFLKKRDNGGTKTVGVSVSSPSSSFGAVYAQQTEMCECDWRKGMLSSQMVSISYFWWPCLLRSSLVPPKNCGRTNTFLSRWRQISERRCQTKATPESAITRQIIIGIGGHCMFWLVFPAGP